MKRVSLFMDVEDPINPLADDAALEFSEIFRQSGIRGNFCITGAKCRSLVQRGRADVIESLSNHCLGLHTDTHSEHPTTMELLGPLGYEEGCIAALKSESKGVDSFMRAFGRRPVFWGGAGNTWSPEICHALRQLTIPAYAYALTSVGSLHRFDGVLALPQQVSVGEDDLMRPDWSAENTISNIESATGDWVGAFVSHPTRFRYRQFWDYGFAGGNTPAAPGLATPTDDSDYERGKANLRRILQEIASRYLTIGVDELLQLPMAERTLSEAERTLFDKETGEAIRRAAKWPIHAPELDVENVVRKTLALGDTVRVVDLTA